MSSNHRAPLPCDRVQTRLWDTHLFLERFGAGMAVTTDVELETNLTTQLHLCALYVHAHSQDRDRIATTVQRNFCPDRTIDCPITTSRPVLS